MITPHRQRYSCPHAANIWGHAKVTVEARFDVYELWLNWISYSGTPRVRTRARHISFMSKACKSYLRTHRKRCCLTQLEVAQLLGLASGQIISRYERLGRSPSLETVLACQILFDVLPHDLYPGLYQKVEKLTMQRIKSLIEQLEGDLITGPQKYKCEVLVCAIERIRMRNDNV